MSRKRTNTSDFQVVPYRRYDELVDEALYQAITDKLEEVFSDLETEYGVVRKQSATDAFTYDDYTSNWGVRDGLTEALYRMGLDVKRDWSSAWDDEYDANTAEGIWNNPASVALFEEEWEVYDSLDDMPEQVFPRNEGDPTRPASDYQPISDIRYWEGCPWHRDYNSGGKGALYKKAIDDELMMPLFIDVGYYEIYASGGWTWDESRITRGTVPVISFRDDWMRVDEIRYMGEPIPNEPPFVGRVFYNEDADVSNGRGMTAFSQMREALCVFFAACEEAGVAPYMGEYDNSYGEVVAGEYVFGAWYDSHENSKNPGEYEEALDAAWMIADGFSN